MVRFPRSLISPAGQELLYVPLPREQAVTEGTVLNKVLRMLVVAVLGLSAMPAEAKDGRYLYIGADGSGAGFLDLSTISGGPAPMLKVMFVPRSFTVGDHSALYFAIVHVRVDCAARTTQMISAKGYSDVGDLVRNDGVSAAERVDPASLTSVNMLRVSCKLPGAPSDKIFDSQLAAIQWWRTQ